ncbi:MAG: putative Ig domain-containing protein [Thermoanaerobaculia bacterium]
MTATDANGCTGSRAYTLVIDCPVITVSPASLANATAGAAYGPVTLTQTGGVGTVTYAVTTGALPSGITLTTAGVLSGTPTVTGTFNITVTATDANGCTGTRAYTLVVECPVITVTPATFPGGTTGIAYSQSVGSAGGLGTVTYAVTTGALPTGLVLDGASGAITGTPTAAGTYNFTVTATDANGCTGSQAYTVVIVCPTIAVGPVALTNGTVGTAYGQTVLAAGGGGAYLYAVTAGTLPAGLALDGASGAITGTPTTADLYAFTITATDQYGCSGATAYEVRICPVIEVTPATAAQGTIGQSYAGTTFAQTGGVLPIGWSATGVPAGLTLDAATGALTGTPTEAGGFAVVVTATDANGCTGSVAFTLRICPEMAIDAPASLADGTVGTAYGPVTFTQTGSAAAITWSATGLPTGLTLDPTTGTLTGTPGEPGSFTVVVTATDANGCAISRSYPLTISCPTITLSPGALPGATAGEAYGQTITASSALSGGSYSFSIPAGAPPAGLTLNATTGEISGTPTAVGTFNVTVRATHDPTGCTGDQAYALVVSCATITVAGGAPPTNVTAGVAGYTHTFTATGGVSPRTFSATGTLPTGLTLDSTTGVLSGTPTVTGTFNFTIVATDSATGATCTGSAPFSVTVVCPTIAVSPATLGNGTAGVAYGPVTLTQTGGVGTVTYAVTAGALPAGINLSSAGVVAGTPTVTGTFNFTVTATDANGCTGTRAYTLVVACPVITVSPASLANATAGTAYGPVSLTQTGGVGTTTYAVTAGAPPTGITLTTAGVLSGTPTVTGTFDFTVTATDANGCTGTRAYTLVVACPVITVTPATLTGGTTGVAYSQSVGSTGGLGTVAYTVTAGLPPAGLALTSAGVLSGTPTAAGSYMFTVTATDANGCTGSQAYTVVIVCPTIAVGPGTLTNGTVGTAYSQTVVGAGGGGTYLYAVTAGTPPAGLSLDGASGAITGTPTAADLYAFTITATDQYGCSGATAYEVRICPVIEVTPATAAQGTIGQIYAGTTFAQTGGVLPIGWSATGLPAGLTLDAATGLLSGTATEAGGFAVVVTATDANGCTGSVAFTLRICPEMAIDAPASLADGTVGTAYGPVTFTQTGSAAAITWSATGLPTGLTLDPATGALTGTPGEPGSFTVVVTATDANGCAVSRSYPLTISCPTITLSPGTLPDATAATAYSQTVTASSALAGGTYAYSILSGALPAGLSLGAAGEISGTPTAVGTFNVTVRATHDLTGCTGDQAYSLVVACATITVGGGAPPTNVTAGVAGYTHTFTATGGVSPRIFSATGTLPTGLTLTSAGVLSGTPTVADTFNFTIVATDSATGATCTGSTSFSITVVCPTITVSPATLPGGIEGTAYSETVTAAGGTGPYGFAVTAGALPTGLTLGTDGAITGTPSADGEFTFTITATDSATACTGSRAYTVRICPVIGLSAVPTCATVGSAFSTTIIPSAGTAPFTFAATGTLPTGTTLDAGTGVLSGPLSAAGSFSFSVTATDVNGCTGSQSYTVNVLDMAPAAGALPEATWNVAYSQAVTASGGTGGFTYAVTPGALPTWLTLNPTTGALTGTPSGADGTGSFTFTITATNTATTCTVSRAYTLVSRPAIAADSYTNGAGNTQYAAGGYTPAPTTPFVSSATNILTNDGGPAGMTAALVSAPASGTLTLNPDGSFLFTPNPGVGGTISFTYKVTSNGVDSAANATVSIVLAGEVWYVNGAVANGTGISSAPFNNLTSAETASGVNDVVYVHTGSGQTAGSIILEAGQTLWGQGAAYSLTGTGLTIPSGAKPTLSGSVVLGGSGITVSSLDIATSTGTGLWDNQAGGITGITVGNNLTVAATGFPAVDLTSVTASAFGITFASLTSTNSAGKGVNLSGIGGALISTTTTVTNPALVGIDVQTTAGAVSLGYASSTSSGGTGVNLASNAGTVSFAALIVVPDSGQRGLLATENIGTLSTTSGTITTTNATAVEITHSSLATPVAMSFTSISANGGTNGVLLTRVTGTFLAAGGLLQNATGADFEISYGTANVSYAGSISDDVGTLVSVANATGGTKTFSGPITDLDNGNGSGVSLTSNTGAMIVFQGGLVLSTGANPAFTATGGGTAVVCDENPCGASGTNGPLVNKLTTTTATALNVANTTIGANDLEFRSISSNGGSSTGIILDTTGASGGLKVKGTGSAGSGGTIANKTGADGSTTTGVGIYLNSTSNVSLAWMQLNTFDNSGIVGRSVTGFTLTNSVLNGVIGSNSGVVEGPIMFGVTNPFGANGLQGTGLIRDAKVSGGVEHNVEFYNQSGSMTLTIEGTTAPGTTSGACEIRSNSAAFGSDGILMEMQGTATANVTIRRCYFDDNKSQAVQAAANDSSSIDIRIEDSVVRRSAQGNEGFILSNGSNGDLTAHVLRNDISGIGGPTIFVGQTPGNATAASSLTAVIQGNVVDHPATATNSAILAWFTSSFGGVVAPANVLIDDNTVTERSTNGTARGIFVDTPDTSTTPGFTTTITNNSVSVHDNVAGLRGIEASVRRGTGCFDIQGNTVTYPNGIPSGVVGLRLRQVAPATANLEQGGSAGSPAAVLAANNPATTTEVLNTVTVVGNNTCSPPPS